LQVGCRFQTNCEEEGKDRRVGLPNSTFLAIIKSIDAGVSLEQLLSCVWQTSSKELQILIPGYGLLPLANLATGNKYVIL